MEAGPHCKAGPHCNKWNCDTCTFRFYAQDAAENFEAAAQAIEEYAEQTFGEAGEPSTIEVNGRTVAVHYHPENACPDCT